MEILKEDMMKDNNSLEVSVGIQLKNIKPEHDGKFIFCNIEVQEEEENGKFILIGHTENQRFSKFVEPSFIKQINTDFCFEKNLKYKLNFYIGNQDKLDLIDDPSLHDLVASVEFFLNDCVLINQ